MCDVAERLYGEAVRPTVSTGLPDPHVHRAAPGAILTNSDILAVLDWVAAGADWPAAGGRAADRHAPGKIAPRRPNRFLPDRDH